MAGVGLGLASVVVGFDAMKWAWLAWAIVFIPSLAVNIVRWFIYDRGRPPDYREDEVVDHEVEGR